MKAALLLLVASACGRFGFDAQDGADTDARGDGVPGGDVGGGADAAPTSYSTQFTGLGATGALSARRGTGAAEGNDARIWVFGGFLSPTGAVNDLAAFTPSTSAWATLVGANAPTARERHALAWDRSNNVLALFGGYSGSFPSFVHHDELYVYTPGTNAWTQIPKAGTWPAPRKDATLVWSPQLSAFLMYGGADGAGSTNRFAELWKLTINVAVPSATWTQLAPGGVPTPALSAVCADYDPSGHRFIMFGGNPTDSSVTTTTYEYLVDTNSWQVDSPTGMIPGGRAFAACAWAPMASRLIVWGGQDAGGSPIAGTFTYQPDMQLWTIPPVVGTAAGARSDVGATYSAALGAMFGFGGRTASTTYTNQTVKLVLVPM